MKFVNIKHCSGKTIMPNGVHAIGKDRMLFGFTDGTCAILEASGEDGEAYLSTATPWADLQVAVRAGRDKEFRAAGIAIGLLSQADADAAVAGHVAWRAQSIAAKDRAEYARLKIMFEPVAAEVALRTTPVVAGL